jgi:hypothetical protein
MKARAMQDGVRHRRLLNDPAGDIADLRDVPAVAQAMVGDLHRGRQGH